MKLDIISGDDKTIKKINYFDFKDPNNVFFRFENQQSLLVNDLEDVFIGTPLIRNRQELPITSSISGKITLKDNLLCVTNNYQEIKIPSKTQPQIAHISKEDLLECLTKNRMLTYFLNGLEYPEHLIINFLDQNLNEFNNHFLIKEYLTELLDTLELIKKCLNIPKITLYFNKNDYEVVKLVKKINLNYPLLSLEFKKSYYPCNLNYFYQKENKTLVLNPSIILNVYFLLKNSSFSTFKYLTINDHISNKIYVLKVKYGTSMIEILKKLNLSYSKCTFYCNNFLLQKPILNIRSIIITDSINSLHLFSTKKAPESVCINCGKCLNICPLKLNPLKNGPKCSLKCGLCSYICPVNINLLKEVSNANLQ